MRVESGRRHADRFAVPFRQQKRNVLDYLSSCFEAHLRGQKVPSLLPTN